jgi:hypothetical protein
LPNSVIRRNWVRLLPEGGGGRGTDSKVLRVNECVGRVRLSQWPERPPKASPARRRVERKILWRTAHR